MRAYEIPDWTERRIRRTVWDKSMWAELSKSGVWARWDSGGRLRAFNSDILFHEDYSWEPYEEPAKPVVVRQWRFFDKEGSGITVDWHTGNSPTETEIAECRDIHVLDGKVVKKEAVYEW